MSTLLVPKSESELAEIIRSASQGVVVQGLGSKPMGHLRADIPKLSLQSFTGIEAYEPEELILEAKSATPLADIEVLLKKHGQMLAFEPPDYASVFGSTSKGTLGGLMASGFSGPRRLKAGAARDHILGINAVSGAGTIFKSGARVVKNVTGYDLSKLFVGSFGTLAAATSIIVKVLPRPEVEETLIIRGLDDSSAITTLSMVMQSNAEVASAAHVPGEGTYIRLEGIAPSVAYRRDALSKLLDHDTGLMSDSESRALWQDLRDLKPFHAMKEAHIWRVSTVPSEAPRLIRKLAGTLTFKHYYDWAGGLVWLAVYDAPDAGAFAIRRAVSDGHATLMRSTQEVIAAVGAFQPQAPALAALSARVKQAFDPEHRLNPGRMYGHC